MCAVDVAWCGVGVIWRDLWEAGFFLSSSVCSDGRNAAQTRGQRSAGEGRLRGARAASEGANGVDPESGLSLAVMEIICCRDQRETANHLMMVLDGSLGDHRDGD